MFDNDDDGCSDDGDHFSDGDDAAEFERGQVHQDGVLERSEGDDDGEEDDGEEQCDDGDDGHLDTLDDQPHTDVIDPNA